MPNLAEQLHPELTERDLEPVRDLILGLVEDANRRARDKQLAQATVTWTNAFISFKRLRNKIGLPVGQAHKLYYGAILAALKASGKLLLAHMLKSNFDLESAVDITVENFQACVEELSDDDRLLESGLLDDGADLSRVAAAFSAQS